MDVYICGIYTVGHLGLFVGWLVFLTLSNTISETYVLLICNIKITNFFVIGWNEQMQTQIS